eukprot:CAMPEP_0185778830 /NCGR_PEP_ID=MMETSP1174-20130828/93799_1 /TAXON_ID=35687 /ORGANISM="Dictyocha speculum, Strain CCMP1381" /LENGTH=30 /DNA_ID= /DNA_START= /DNA_END= /DNA_ORIENTATION=
MATADIEMQDMRSQKEDMDDSNETNPSSQL